MTPTTAPALKSVRIFVSSPGDVQAEREIAERVIRSLAGEFAGRLLVEGYFWEYEPMMVTTDFQDQIERPSGFDIVLCILWSRLGSRLHTKHLRPDGTPYSSGTEFEFEDAAAANRERGVPDILLYVNRTPPSLQGRTREERSEALRQVEALEAFLEAWTKDAAEGTWKGAFTGYTDLARFEKLVDEHLRKLLTRRAPASVVGDEVVAASWRGGSPFRGLESFEFEHAGIFFGRTRAVGEVLKSFERRLHAGAPKFVLVSGMSGSGKSSLVHAGVLPLLTRPGVVGGTGVWLRASMRPGGSGACERMVAALAGAGIGTAAANPDANNASRLVSAVGAALTAAGAFRHAGDRRNLEMRILEYEQEGRQEDAERCREILGGLVPPVAGLALVIDQLEELFAQPPGERECFARLIESLLEEGRVWVIATMRADRFPQLRDVPALAGLCEGDSVFTLLPPDPAALGQMIRKPAFAAGLSFEVDATTGEHLDDILRDAALHDPGCLPLLQFTLEELHRRRKPGNVLTLAAYREIGGIEGAIGRRAEEIFLVQESSVRGALPQLLRAICDTGPMGAVRRWAPAGAGGADAGRLASVLVDSRLLVEDIAADGTPVVSVAHEALFWAWPRAADWYARNAEFLRLRVHLLSAAERWRAGGMNADFLLADGKPLADAEALLGEDAANIDVETKAYIEASSMHRKLLRSRALRRFQAIAAALTVLALFALAAAVFGFVQRAAAERRSMELQTALTEADLQLGTRMVAAGQADRALAPLARAATHSRAAAWRAANLLRQRGWFLPDGPVVDQKGPVRAVAFSPDESLFAAAGDAGSAQIYETAGGSPHGPALPQTGVIGHLAFSPDGSLLATGSDDGTVCVWKTSDGTPALGPLLLGEPVGALGISPDGSMLFAAGGDINAGNECGALQVWRVHSGEPCGPRHELASDVTAAVFSPDGAWIAIGLMDGTLTVRGTASGHVVFGGRAFQGAVESLAFQGNRLLASGADGVAKIFDLTPGGGSTIDLVGHGGAVAGAVFSPSGGQVATASADGMARIWDAESGALLRTIEAGGFVQAVAFCGDGSRLLTVSQSPTRESAGISTTLRLWDAGTGEEILTPISGAGVCHSFALDRAGGRILAGWDDGPAEILRLQPAEGLVSRMGSVMTPAWIAAAGSDRAAMAGLDGGQWKVGVFRRPGEVIWIENTTAAVTAMESCPAGDRLAMGLENGHVLIRRLSDGAPVGMASNLDAPAAGLLAFSADGNRLAAAPMTNDGKPVRVTVFRTGGPPVFLAHADRVRDLQFSPDGRELITACHDGYARIWELPSGSLRMAVELDGMVTGAGWSPDGREVLLTTDAAAWIFSARDGRPKTSAMEGTASGGAEFSPSGEIVVTWSPSSRPRLWHAADGRALGRPLAADGTGRPVFVGGGRFLLTAPAPYSDLFLPPGEGGVVVWDVMSGVPVCDPIPSRGGDVRICASGATAWMIDGGNQASVISLPPDEDAPAWLSTRAEATGRWKMLDGGSLGRVARPGQLWRDAENGEVAGRGAAWREFIDPVPEN